jgi:hypothetical protein
MNNEQQELLNEAYEKYYATLIDSITFSERGKHFKSNGLEFNSGYPNYVHYSKEEFINKCKTDPEFSEKWGLKIEERELSLEEKEWQLEKTHCINDIENDRIIYGHEWEKYIQRQYEGIQSNQCIKIPTKIITITYNDKTIESYK